MPADKAKRPVGGRKTVRRRRILTQLNRGESRHALAHDACHGYAANCASANAKTKRSSSARY